MSGTFASPVSDGQCVYAIGSNDQVACLDMNGKIVWIIMDRVNGKRPDTLQCYYASSPQLCGEVLIVTVACTMRGYDKKTNKPLPMSATVVPLNGAVQKVGNAFNDDRYETDDRYFFKWSFRASGNNSSPMFQANRMFFRTTGCLWSIGDKSWHTPKDAPPTARVP